MKAICICNTYDDGSISDYLTIGKIYEIHQKIEYGVVHYVVDNDYGERIYVMDHTFAPLDKYRSDQIKEILNN